MQASSAVLPTWRCVSWPRVVAIWVITIITLVIEVRVGISLSTALGVVVGAGAVTKLIEWFMFGPLVWVRRMSGLRR